MLSEDDAKAGHPPWRGYAPQLLPKTHAWWLPRREQARKLYTTEDDSP